MASSAIPKRENIPGKDKWNLSSLYASPEAWEEDLKKLEAHIPEISEFKGTLADSAEQLKSCLDLVIQKVDLLEERLGYYTMLRREENVGDSESQGRFSRYMATVTKLAASASWLSPEIQAIPDEKMKAFMADPLLKEYGIYLNKLLRFKEYTPLGKGRDPSGAAERIRPGDPESVLRPDECGYEIRRRGNQRGERFP